MPIREFRYQWNRGGDVSPHVSREVDKSRVAPPAAQTRGLEGRHGSMMACSSASSVSWRDRPAPPHPRAPPQPGRLTTGWALGHVIGAPPFDIGLLSHSLERRAPSVVVPYSFAQTGRGRARADEGHPAPGDGASVSWLDACLGLGPGPSLPCFLDLVDWTWEAETACLRPSQRRETGP